MLNSLSRPVRNSETARSDGYVEYYRPMASPQATECRTHHKYRETGESMSISEMNFTYIKEALRNLKNRIFSIKLCKCGNKKK